MANKMDGVKISVSEEDDNKTGQAKSIAAKRNSAKKPAAVKTAAVKSKNTGNKRKRSGSFLVTLIAVVVTAAIVGGGVYAWQNKEVQQKIDAISTSARNTRIQFEQQVANLKSSLSGAQQKNKDLQTANSDLTKKAALLQGASKSFSNDDLGLSFEYPAAFGDVKLTITDNPAGGKVYQGQFTDNDKLTFGGVSQDYVPATSSKSLALNDTLGFRKAGRNYYFLPPGNNRSTDYVIQPMQTVNTASGQEVLVLSKNSFSTPSKPNLLPVDLGENVGAIVNLNDKTYPGLAFIDMDFGQLPMDQFTAMMGTIKTK